MSWKPKSVIVTFLVAASLVVSSFAASADSPATVQIEGSARVLTGNVKPVFKVNELVRIPNSLIGMPGPGGFEETFGFDPSDIEVDSGTLALGDTHLVGPAGGQFRTSFTTKVNLPAGAVLFYMCSFHPQMQGKIIVEGDDERPSV